MTTVVRGATEEDFSAIRSIFEHYVSNTLVSFLVHQPDVNYIKTRFDASRERGLPYLVAVRQSSASENIVGYASASAFRGFMLGYGHTVEMSIFCAPGYTGMGIGGLLMKDLLLKLQTTKHVSKEANHEDKPQEFEIKNVLAVMSVDEDAPGQGLGLRDWYLKWGFEQVGRLKGVGYKNGRTLILPADASAGRANLAGFRECIIVKWNWDSEYLAKSSRGESLPDKENEDEEKEEGEEEGEEEREEDGPIQGFLDSK